MIQLHYDARAGRPGRAAGGPLLSVVLAVRGVEEYLPGCLDSILGQPGLPAGIEVIAVDDASPDNCGAILDARAAADPRLRAVHLPGQAGPGPARMRGQDDRPPGIARRALSLWRCWPGAHESPVPGKATRAAMAI